MIANPISSGVSIMTLVPFFAGSLGGQYRDRIADIRSSTVSLFLANSRSIVEQCAWAVQALTRVTVDDVEQAHFINLQCLQKQRLTTLRVL